MSSNNNSLNQRHALHKAWKNQDIYIIGKILEVKGLKLTGLQVQEFYCNGELTNAAHIVFLQLGNSKEWHKLFIDGLQLYFYTALIPESHEYPDEPWQAPLRDLGADLDLVGAELSALYYGISNNMPSLTLNFSDGRQITFAVLASSDKDTSRTGFELAVWYVNS